MEILEAIIRIIFIGIGTGFFSVALEADKEDLPINALMGAICYGTYIYILNLFNSLLISTLLASLLVSFLAIYLTRKREKPLQIYLVAGIIPLLPGYSIFKMVLGFVNQDFSTVLLNTNLTLQILGVIVVSVIIASSLTKILKKIKIPV